MTLDVLNLKAAEEGCVLLLNKETLPFTKSDSVCIFGRGQFDWLKCGMGSGGFVNTAYSTNLTDSLIALEKKGKGPRVNPSLVEKYRAYLAENPFDNANGQWAQEPYCQKEMPLEEAYVKSLTVKKSKAVYVISRNAADDKDLIAQRGSWFLNKVEEKNLTLVCKYFEKVTVIFNTCSIVDTNFIYSRKFKNHITAVLYAWQAGMEGGKACAHILSGIAVPCGKLPDTIARDIKDYPSVKNFGSKVRNFYEEDIFVGYRYFNTFAKNKILFPFGYGLSYTEFSYMLYECESDADLNFHLKFKVTNIGDTFSGKEILQCYVKQPQGKLGKSDCVLTAFVKTKVLSPSESEIVEMNFNLKDFASFDDSGITGHKNAWILEKGPYEIYCGINSLKKTKIITKQVEEDVIVEQLEEACAPVLKFKRLTASGKKEVVPLSTVDMAKRIKENLPEELKSASEKKLTFADVKKNPDLIDEFVAQLSVKQLATIVRGEGMISPKVTMGVASAFGGLSEDLYELGIPVAACADGPSGIRFDTGGLATLLPSGTTLASTWNVTLVEELYNAQGQELLDNQVDTLLGPGLNIHRCPLNGRNFEYFSEDPFLTGCFAVAQLNGHNRLGVYGTAKHYCCNSQELCRTETDSVLSQRALREIYLKAFEIAVKNKSLHSIMTCYNAINGHWGASNYDTVNTILFKQWGYEGLVMTDWWAKMNDCVTGGEASMKNMAAMIRARNSVYMVVDNDGAATNAFGDNIEECLKTGELTLAELQLCVKDILKFILTCKVSQRSLRKLKQVLEFKPLKLTEKTIDSSLKTVTVNENFIPEDKKLFYLEIAEDGVYNINATYTKTSNGMGQSVVVIEINSTPYATLECRTTSGKDVTVVSAQAILSSGKYTVKVIDNKPGIIIKNMSFIKD